MSIVEVVAGRPSVSLPDASGELIEGAPLTVALVNNMPDGAFADTEAQFRSLLDSASTGRTLRLDRYTLDGIVRGDHVQTELASYRSVQEIYDVPPDALIITGTEPHSPVLRDEPYWSELSHLLRWATVHVPSMIVSCLAAHAYLLAIDGIPRRRLPEGKLCGVYQQRRKGSHPIVTDIELMTLPHSRFNEVPTEALLTAGYDISLASPDSGWTVASRRIGAHLAVLLQGHPEYGEDTLLREYRRDARRYLASEQATYPALPVGYLDPEGEALLLAFQRDHQDRRNAAAIDAFPFDEAAAHIRARWRPEAERLFDNWLECVAQARLVSHR